MNNRPTRAPIPWVHKSNPIVSTWVWETPHFILSIFAEGLSAKKMYNWKIVDKSSGIPRAFDSAPAISFPDAVDAAIEVIAKSYARELGYQAYAGELATTFSIANGKSYDFAPVIGESVIMKAYDVDGSETLITGLFDLLNYDFVVYTNGSSGVVVPPNKVIDILKEYGMSSLLNVHENGIKSSRKRGIIHEEWRKGCTGKAGFHAGTVEHGPNDKYCPIHGV